MPKHDEGRVIDEHDQVIRVIALAAAVIQNMGVKAMSAQDIIEEAEDYEAFLKFEEQD
jgi:hypothetical protein